MKVKLLYISFAMLICLEAWAQDPHFTQFDYAPFSVNPAYTGAFYGKARVITNYRNQWGNISSPFSTAAVSADMKIGLQDDNGSNPLNIGVQLMNDRSMKGSFQSNYATLTASYFVKLDYTGRNRLGAGLSGSYGSRRIDFSKLSFDQQFTLNGFDLSLPTGESAFQSMKPFATVGAGLLYRHENEETGEFLDFGVSGFHFNKPVQTILEDKNRFVPLRFSCQFTYQKYIDDQLMVNLKGLYQNQASVHYYQAGLSLATFINEYDDFVGAGVWYRTGDAISPHVFVEYRKLLVGFSYDVAVSQLKSGTSAARSMEVSLQWRLDEP
jgi:type IX secretion system PorP/SprF family membrane protein